MTDRSSRPQTEPGQDKPGRRPSGSCRCGCVQRLGPVQLAALAGVASSTAHRVLVRCRLNRLSHVDRATGEPVRRYEHDHPGAMLHVDVKKLGNIPDGGGWRFVGRRQRRREPCPATPGKPKGTQPRPMMGHAFVHTVIDDHSRVAYAEVHDDETAVTAVAVLRRAVAWFAARGRHRREGALRQRVGVPLPPVARHLHRTRHQAHPHPALPAPDQRQDRTLPPHPGRRLGLRPLLRLGETNAAPLCQPGYTSTTTTAPTPPAGTSRPSPA